MATTLAGLPQVSQDAVVVALAPLSPTENRGRGFSYPTTSCESCYRCRFCCPAATAAAVPTLAVNNHARPIPPIAAATHAQASPPLSKIATEFNRRMHNNMIGDIEAISANWFSPCAVTANPANIKYMLKTRFDNFPKGWPFSMLLGNLLGRGIFNIDGEEWRHQRKLASLELGSSAVRAYTQKIVMQEVSTRLLPVLAAVEQDATLDLRDVFRRLAFDTMCKISFGLDLGGDGRRGPSVALPGGSSSPRRISGGAASPPGAALPPAGTTVRLGHLAPGLLWPA